jgi:hypothetical protein
MSFDLSALLNNLVPVLGEAGVGALTGELKDLAAGQEGWKKSILSLLADAVEKNGPGGIALAMTEINKLLDGKVPDIDWADLEVASDVLAHLQNVEADQKSKMNDFLVKLSHTLGTVLGALLKGILSA